MMSVPVQAQEEPPEEDMGEGIDLMQEGAKIILRGLMGEMDDVIEDLDQMAQDLGPFLMELQILIEDISAYHLPEVLPNGDIIIRRRVPLAPDTDEGEIEI